VHWWISHVVLIIAGQTPIDLNLGTPETPNSGKLSSSAAAGN